MKSRTSSPDSICIVSPSLIEMEMGSLGAFHGGHPFSRYRLSVEIKTGSTGAPDSFASSASPGRSEFTTPCSLRVRVPSGKKKQPAALGQPLCRHSYGMCSWRACDKTGESSPAAKQRI
ncbi:MAG: hypothetical protein LW829_00670 [Luteolibacter sp.]|nr:hypothetical protein [Luteolibacter sp.]